MHDLAFCTVQFHPISITSVLKVIQFFLYDTTIFVCVDGASQLCTICIFHLNTLTFCAKFINERLNEISPKTDLWGTPPNIFPPALYFCLQHITSSLPLSPTQTLQYWLILYFPPVNWVVPKWHLLKYFNEDWIHFKNFNFKNVFYQKTSEGSLAQSIW